MYTTITTAHYDGLLSEIADLRARLGLEQGEGVNYMDGKWHDWGGGACPVPGSCIVEVKFRGGVIANDFASNYCWLHDYDVCNIVKFRVVCFE